MQSLTVIRSWHFLSKNAFKIHVHACTPNHPISRQERWQIFFAVFPLLVWVWEVVRIWTWLMHVVSLADDPSVIDLDSDWKAPTEEWGNWTGDEEHQTGDEREKVRRWHWWPRETCCLWDHSSDLIVAIRALRTCGMGWLVLGVYHPGGTAVLNNTAKMNSFSCSWLSWIPGS